MQADIPLVMVHGLFGPLHFFDPAARMNGVTVLTPDLLGYGRLMAPPQLSLAAQADEVVRILRSQGRPCNLLGHSVGGAIAILAAARAPLLVRSVISVEGILLWTTLSCAVALHPCTSESGKQNCNASSKIPLAG